MSVQGTVGVLIAGGKEIFFCTGDAQINKQKEKSLNSSKYLNVQDRTCTGCLRSL